MKKFIFLFGILSLLFYSCAKNEKGAKNAKDTENKKNTPSVVRINISSEPDSLDPWQSAAADTVSVFSNVFEGLLRSSPSGELLPCIASDFNISEDKLTYTFNLKKNVVFHNGQKLTARDVLYSYNRFSGLDGKKPVSNKFTSVRAVSASDDYTFKVELFRPDASFLALCRSAILPEGYTAQAEKPVGTGPFRFVSYVPGQKIVFEKNDLYYDERKPKVDRVEVYIMTNPASVISALRSGQLDIAYFINGDDAKLFSSDYNIFSCAQNMVQLLALNNEYGPFKDLRVRQALNYAINKKDIIDGVWAGFADELYTNFSPAFKIYYNDALSSCYNFDVEKAKALLKEAGYADGFDLTITVPSNYEPHVRAAEIIVSQLARVNIRANIRMTEWASWLDRVYGKALYEATVIAFQGKIEPNDILARYESENKRNFIRFKNLDFDKTLASALIETDLEKRISMYKECQKIMTENAASVFICDPSLIVASRKDLHGYTFYPFTFIDFSVWYYE
ncbi:ABC transporter substrate-binding protein [Treponema parvum]|uniref:ABC transporter substrate-binding protein n=1 Tax=Treponema parvum TaxID=138851 RepID=A0A975F3V9_9SPIR|nr:ABC transporter substrate-binding protein [Treponema parvum]QTQ13911.1 ABC transporter substrate-binding protein [Treponema parvum]